MKTSLQLGIVLVIVVVAAGCGSSGKKLTEIDTSVQAQQRNLKEAISQIDRNAADIRSLKTDLAEIQRRLGDLETRINGMNAGSADIQELRENIAFLNDQILRLDNAVSTSKRPAPRPQAASGFKPGGFDVDSAYKAAFDDYQARKYESAISGFTEILTMASTSSLADNAQYWIGESYYSMGNYEKALEAFNKVFNYPKSNKLADAHYKVGKTYLVMGRKDAAADEFRAVVQNYPDTDASKHAAAELKGLGE